MMKTKKLLTLSTVALLTLSFFANPAAAGNTPYSTLQQDILMGFTFERAASVTAVNLKIEVDNPFDGSITLAYLRAGCDVNMGLGLRLPVRINLEYPEKMIVGHDYELYATLTSLDWPDFNEFLARFLYQLWFEMGGTLLPDESERIGPDFDWSTSFATPLGPAMEFPLNSIEIPVWDLPDWVSVSAVIDPQLGSDRITAGASAGGDATGENAITWSLPAQRIPFAAHADDYGPTDFAEIALSNFRYYFSIFSIAFKLKFDFAGWIEDIVGSIDRTITLFTLDASELTEWAYLGVHEGTDGTVDVTVPVLDQLEGSIYNIGIMRGEVTALYDDSEIDQYKYQYILNNLFTIEQHINNAIKYLDTVRHGFDDKVEGFYELKSAVSKLEYLMNAIRTWVSSGKMSGVVADNIISQLETIDMDLTLRAESEALEERTLAVAAIEDAEARGRYAPWLWNDISYIDQYIAQAADCMAKGWLSKAIDYCKTAFSYSQYVVKKAYHLSYGISQEDWIDQLELTQ